MGGARAFPEHRGGPATAGGAPSHLDALGFGAAKAGGVAKRKRGLSKFFSKARSFASFGEVSVLVHQYGGSSALALAKRSAPASPARHALSECDTNEQPGTSGLAEQCYGLQAVCGALARTTLVADHDAENDRTNTATSAASPGPGPAGRLSLLARRQAGPTTKRLEARRLTPDTPPAAESLWREAQQKYVRQQLAAFGCPNSLGRQYCL